MQAIKEKLHDMGEMRKVKAEAREEEKAEKDLAKARVDVAHEIRMAKEAEAAMDLHVNKAVEKAQKHEAKYPSHSDQTPGDDLQNPYGYSNQMGADSTNATYAGSDTGKPTTGIRDYATNTVGGSTAN